MTLAGRAWVTSNARSFLPWDALEGGAIAARCAAFLGGSLRADRLTARGDGDENVQAVEVDRSSGAMLTAPKRVKSCVSHVCVCILNCLCAASIARNERGVSAD